MGKKFVIMEVEEQHTSNAGDDTTLYYPIDRSTGEVIWLHPSRIIDADRLRYGMPQGGEETFDIRFHTNEWAFRKALPDFEQERLILDPEPKPKSDLDRALDKAPLCVDSEAKAWVRDSLLPEVIEHIKREMKKEN